MKDIIILIDMDGVITDFNGTLTEKFHERFPQRPLVDLEKVTTTDLEDSYPLEDKQRLKDIYQSRGFFRELRSMPGALEALEELRRKVELFICTAPLTLYENCVLEKYQWVEENLGKEWVKRIILTKEKTLVHGDILIDDRVFTGIRVPSWEHVVYDQPSNRQFTDKRRLTWDNYRGVLGL